MVFTIKKCPLCGEPADGDTQLLTETVRLAPEKYDVVVVGARCGRCFKMFDELGKDISHANNPDALLPRG